MSLQYMRVQYTSQKKGGRTVTDNSHLSKPLYPTRLKISHQIVCLCAEKLPFAYSGLHIVLTSFEKQAVPLFWSVQLST